MTAGPGTFAYSQARLQARIGTRAAAADLQRARAARDLPAFLQLVRSTPQGRFVARLDASTDPHEMERRLREEWTATVDEVARWQPTEWQAALHWLRWLPYLPALQKIARSGRAPEWARSDPVLGRIVAMDPGSRAGAFAGTELAPLHDSVGNGRSVVQRWVEHWRSLWPAANARGLDQVARAVAALDDALRAAPPAAQSEDLYSGLANRLLRIFRRHPLSPAAAVAYLGLEALDLLALRGGVMTRAVLAPVTL